jgi:hypothetical protein
MVGKKNDEIFQLDSWTAGHLQNRKKTIQNPATKKIWRCKKIHPRSWQQEVVFPPRDECLLSTLKHHQRRNDLPSGYVKIAMFTQPELLVNIG